MEHIKTPENTNFPEDRQVPIIALPGLGVDHRLFGQLELSQPVLAWDWPDPLPGEQLEAFTLRLSNRLPEGPVMLMGVSFGGIVMQQMARLLPDKVRGLILISTLGHWREKPSGMKLLKFLPLYQLGRGKWRLRFFPQVAPFFGVKHPDEIRLIKSMFARATDRHRMWGMQQIIQWRGEIPAETPYLRLHGTEDRFFPKEKIGASAWIEGGYHFMVYQQGAEVSHRINAWIREGQKRADQ
ncbi:MAG: alpha/beta hydrolase [Bacteroidota bacterium]